jgi:putative sigma-54 modulation protein
LPLKITVSTRHAGIPERARQYAESKAGKLSKYFDRLQFVEVVLDRDHQDWKAEIIATGDHKVAVVAQHTSADLLAAIDVVIDKVERQLTREKEKKRNRKHIVRRGPAGQELAAEGETIQEQ